MLQLHIFMFFHFLSSSYLGKWEKDEQRGSSFPAGKLWAVNLSELVSSLIH